MVEHFTTKEHDTRLGEKEGTMVKDDEIFEDTLRTNFSKLVKDPSPRTIENILNFSKSLTK